MNNIENSIRHFYKVALIFDQIGLPLYMVLLLNIQGTIKML